jgi:hypothetical protein
VRRLSKQVCDLSDFILMTVELRPALLTFCKFARDAPSLLLVEGAGMEDRPGCSETQWIEIVCQWVLLHAGVQADTVFDIANQNLGIFCYEHVVKAFGSRGGVIVKQAGDHAIALEADASSLAISFASSFLLLDAGARILFCAAILFYVCRSYVNC